MDRPKRKQSRPLRFSPTPTSHAPTNKNKRKSLRSGEVSGDLLANGSLFLCDKCGSTFLDTRVRGVRKKCKVVHPTVRYADNGKELLYCCTCGMDHDRKTNSNTAGGSTLTKKTRQISQPDEELAVFTNSLSATTGLPNASKLKCYNSCKSCQCLPSYLKNCSELLNDVNSLLDIMSEAEQLKSLKVNNAPAGTRNRNIGLGNGKKRSKLYENYVKEHRPRLREELQLCEPTTQKILGYSNNFLHRSLLTEEKRTRLGEKTRESLQPITMLWKKDCCRDNCTKMVRTHLNLIAKWRQLSVESRRGLQQAVAELLTPTAGAKTNCYKFITMVTGCSTATIAKVVSKIKKNGGVLGMHEHGLRKYWRKKREMETDNESSDDELPNVWTLPQHHAEEVQLRQTVDKQKQELEELKSQLSEQQKKIDEQQRQLTVLNKHCSTSAVLKSPSLMLKSPPIGTWRADISNAPTADTASVPSPQYPHRGASSKSLLQPSKLDCAVKQHHGIGSQSNSTVVAVSKQSFIPQPVLEAQQPVVQAMQYYYSNNPDMANMFSKPDSVYLGQPMPSGERAHIQSFGTTRSYTQELFSHTHMTSVPPTVDVSHASNHYLPQPPLANSHPHSQLHYL